MNKFLFGKAKRTVDFIARVAMMLALTLVMQYITKFVSVGSQIAIGSVVNMMLLLTCMSTGILGGVIVGLCTPFLGMAIGLGGSIAVLPFIALANAIYIVLFACSCKLLKFDRTKKATDFMNITKGIVAVVISAGVKFLFLYFIVLQLILPLVLTQLPAPIIIMLGITQFFTALIGGFLGVAISFPLSKTNVM